MKALFAIIGAICGVLLMYAVVSRLYDPPYSSLDILTPILLIAAHGVALILGWIIGYAVADRLDRKPPRARSQGDNQSGEAPPRPSPHKSSPSPDGRWGTALRMVLVGIAIIALIPVLIIHGVPLLLRTESDRRQGTSRSPARRAEWAARLSSFYATDPTRLDNAARDLAFNVESCIGDAVQVTAEDVNRPCKHMRATWGALTPDSLAILGAYQDVDMGMRWTIDDEWDPPRVTVVPDVLLEVKGEFPVYEITAGRVVRRDNANAPSFALDSTLIEIDRSFDCFEASAAALRLSGRWNGDYLELPALIVDYQPTDGCPRLHFYDEPVAAQASWEFEPGRFHFRALRDYAAVRLIGETGPVATKYRLIAIRDGGMRYMRDEHGGWHMRHGRDPDVTDPAPEPCLLDHEIACD